MCRLLIVEDNPRDLRHLISTIPFAEWGLDVVGTANNGEEALSLAETLYPDIILTDISMPVVNGIEMAQALLKKYPKIKLLFMSHYDDFSFAKSAIELMIHGYILKPINPAELEAACKKLVTLHKADAALAAQLEDSIPILQQSFLQELLSGTGLSEAIIRERLRLLHIRGADFVRLGVISVQLPRENNLDARRIYLNRLEVFNHLTVHSDDYTAHVMQNALHPYVILFFNSDDEKAIRKIMLSYVLTVWERLNGTANFGISTLSALANHMPLLAHQAQAAANARFYSADSPFIFYSEIPFDTTEDETDTLGITNLKREIDEKIFLGESNGVEAFINQYINNQPEDEIYIKSLSYSILNILMLMLTEKGLKYPPIATNAWNNKRLWQKLDSLLTVEDLRQWLKSTLYDVQAFIEEKNTSRYAELVKVVKQVVENRYSEPLSVADIAAAVYLSPKQANVIFKREEGLTIFDYLTAFRISRAKKLLKETDQTIQAIAEQVGYSNKSHFAIVFKRSTGLAPAEYKNKPVI